MLRRNYLIAGLWVTLSMLQTGNALGDACIATATTRAIAVSRASAQCELPVEDCDRFQGQWYCSSENLRPKDIELWLHSRNNADTTTIGFSPSAQCVDPDGDGWGWDGQSSCEISPDQNRLTLGSAQTLSSNPSGSACVDHDGDGWGWDGTASCSTSAPGQRGAQSTANPSSVNNNVGLAQPSYPVDTDCPGSYNPSDITDIILVTGQSNVTGADTNVAADLDPYGRITRFHQPDKSHQRVFAWTVDSHDNNNGTGWKVAALNQSWHDSAPGVGGIGRNNFAFHFAKQVAESPGCRVVGFIMVSEGGRGISHWDNGAVGWTEVNRHVTEALSAIGRSSIDGVLWHQGESDWIVDGTCFTGSTCRDNLPDYYAQKLYSKIANPNIANPVGRQSLIDRLRRTSWFSNNKPFIAAETIKAPVNVHLNKLNSDNDKWTACVRGDAKSGLGIRKNDPHKNHYSAEGLRAIGARYAVTYLKMKGY